MKAISEAVKQKIEVLAGKYELILLVLFGSQVSGFTHAESDVDVAYLSDRKLNFDEEVLLNFDLTEIFGNDKVSLVNFKTAPPLLLKQIVTNALVLYEKTPHIFNEMYVYALKMYEEARPLFELRHLSLKRQIATYASQI